MEKIYSKVNPKLLLHLVVRLDDFNEMENQRIDLIDPENILQCAMLNLKKDVTFRPHKHKPRSRTLNFVPSESWHIISGSVKTTFYDLDDTILCERNLFEGDTSFTLAAAGHNYMSMENNTRVLEYKAPMYEGVSVDKTFIDGK